MLKRMAYFVGRNLLDMTETDANIISYVAELLCELPCAGLCMFLNKDIEELIPVKHI
jgi:hypothetical protein